MRVAITTLGCKVNQYDSASIETRLRQEGCTVVPFAPGADVYIVNSCSVTDRADAESRQLARRARRFAPQARVILTGCFAQTNPHGAAIAEVDHVVGLSRLPDLVRAVKGELGEQRIVVNDLRTARRVTTLGADTFTGQTRAFLKIQEGCDLFCTFCIVPFARGASRSVPPRQVLSQLEMLAERGFQEVVLTGVHLGGYGGDLEPRLGLVDLLAMIAEVSPVPRLRLSSLDPPEVSGELLSFLRQSPIFCPHLHVPVQAGCDTVLGRMRRKYDAALIREMATAVRAELPDAAIGTDVIAGFPGESDAEFEETYELLETLPFTYFHVFPYSRRTGTTAAKLPGHLPPATIRARAQRLRRLGERKQADFARSFVGSRLRVLVEDKPDGQSGRLSGYSRNYQRVELSGSPALANSEIEIVAAAVRGGRLVASPISAQ
ncbi:MAG TPA: tRNA (N(6)-L-threonylcarbamoyladenosine(37)-C(2))-methylthiotransferase MtaB [Terriglobales bacterium]|nr:tRNA (N(6)-L-threonylcarbamoyladenosine(37)-C(2))-methylthiotransferase MtaB [Terriglobales bacterium]